ncbi:MAG: hypothetical protein AAGI34_03555 [Pseudomonadota bacterium]
MKTIVLPVLALALLAFSAPAYAAGCSWGEHTSEKPKEVPSDVSA